jgi:putative transposase
MATLAHKIRLDPTYKQESYFKKACGIARFAWNWALAKWNEKYKANEKPSAFELKKEFNFLKEKEYPWVYEVTKYACQQPFIYIQKAFQAFFSKRAKYPKFKKKGIHDSFYIGGDQLKVNGNKVKIPNLGWVRLREFLRYEGKINGATVSRVADRWMISICVETNHKPNPCENQAAVGVDVGIQTLATLSDGTKIPSQKPLAKRLKKLKLLQRQLSRKAKGSKNRAKCLIKLSRQHYKVASARNDQLHKLTTKLTENFRCIVIEDLDISKMLKNKRLSRQIADGGWYEFRRQLAYKAMLRGNKILIADRWYASSKKCSGCNHIKERLLLSERTYSCLHCGIEIDRDLNAALNLVELINTVSSTEINACGQDGTVMMLKTSLQPAWQKQELCRV